MRYEVQTFFSNGDETSYTTDVIQDAFLVLLRDAKKRPVIGLNLNDLKTGMMMTVTQFPEPEVDNGEV